MTTSLMALVGGTMVAALAGGVRVWERATELGVRQQSILITFERLRRDLHQVRRFAPVPFKGTYDRCEFAGVGREQPDSDQPEEIGRLGYFLDERTHVLCRSFAPFRLTRRYRLTDRCHPELEGAGRVRFSYYGAAEAGGEPRWSEHWEQPGPPIAVKLEVSVTTGKNRQPVPHTLLVDLPTANHSKNQ